MKWFCVLLTLLFYSDLSAAPELFTSDRLSPYEDGSHGSRKTRRDISQCEHANWNNETYEQYNLELTVPESSEIFYELYRYEDTVRRGALSVHRMKYLMGSIAYIRNPYYTFSVLEPSAPGGCNMKYLSAARSTVSATASRRLNGCVLAINAGYFSMTNGQCLGNIISDGRIVQTTEQQNANFGIRHDGTIVVGYISEEEVLSGSFRQLVSGVIWLVRNGTNYVNESMDLECASNQDTGKMSTFVNVLSARSAIGHDQHGRIVIANVEGQTHHRGANLHEFANFLIAHGVVNAINLDGGGSSTFLHNQVLINYPSDHCPGQPAYRCPREVSTILCFHAIECLEPSCNNHGSCFNGECSCVPPWVGRDCGQLNCSLVNCSNSGKCSDGKCVCEPGWRGQMCEEACPGGYYGSGCTSRCWCFGRSRCDSITGLCKCPPGYYGVGCWKACSVGFYGLNCSLRCPDHNCSGNGRCSSVDGTCLCSTNWTGIVCNETRTSQFSLYTRHPIEDLYYSFSSTPSSLTPSSSMNTIVHNGCSDGEQVSGNYGLVLTAICLILLGSLILHIFICIRLKGGMKQFLHAHNTSPPKLQRKRRKRRKRLTRVAQDSSSDCSM